MRLTPLQIKCIKQVAADVLGDQARLMLFGSRVDDTRRGGDIDLYVAAPVLPPEAQLETKYSCHCAANRRSSLKPMTPSDLIALKLQPALAECELHRKRLHQAWLDASAFDVFKPNSSHLATEPEVRTLDQLV